MGALIVLLTPVIEQSLVAGLLREVRFLWIAVNTAEVILVITMTGLCERLLGREEVLLSVALRSGNRGTPGTTGTQESTASDSITEDILDHLPWSLGEHPRARVCRKITVHTNATCRLLGIKD